MTTPTYQVSVMTSSRDSHWLQADDKSTCHKIIIQLLIFSLFSNQTQPQYYRNGLR